MHVCLFPKLMKEDKTHKEQETNHQREDVSTVTMRTPPTFLQGSLVRNTLDKIRNVDEIDDLDKDSHNILRHLARYLSDKGHRADSLYPTALLCIAMREMRETTQK